jgi:phage terminase large subunit GpA-like protein
MHFPSNRDLNYYAQLTAERRVMKEMAGRKFTVWELPEGKRNEALDCRVYSYAALCSLLQAGLRLNRTADVRSEILGGAPPREDDDGVETVPAASLPNAPLGPVIKKGAGETKSRTSQLA